ncbi:restriction endonuclease [Bacillus cereus group sp. BY17LC]|uniref:restriction endonuclease n=1 Tax=unclassified Bacillus cereus group TaxID=2750818 RepID=UPI0022E6BECD|nr:MULTISPECIES: restriction endonuclease [unclassified Bacillus cereus group]MDA1577306.1 restriction endonuclease [Bacillus cereus group sp. TH228LC]MDA1837934.1 restriction endonuclease [Bacillus cereus group sp. BY17LC]
MIWAITLLLLIFFIGFVMRGPHVTPEEIRTERIKRTATRSNLEVMDSREFEYFVADVFRSLGYKVQVTSGSNDGGKDIILYKDNEMKFVEVKRYTKNSIGRPFIQKLHSAIVDADAIGGYFVTLSHFNKNARMYAANKNIELIDGDSLINMMKS